MTRVGHFSGIGYLLVVIFVHRCSIGYIFAIDEQTAQQKTLHVTRTGCSWCGLILRGRAQAGSVEKIDPHWLSWATWQSRSTSSPSEQTRDCCPTKGYRSCRLHGRAGCALLRIVLYMSLTSDGGRKYIFPGKNYWVCSMMLDSGLNRERRWTVERCNWLFRSGFWFLFSFLHHRSGNFGRFPTRLPDNFTRRKGISVFRYPSSDPDPIIHRVFTAHASHIPCSLQELKHEKHWWVKFISVSHACMVPYIISDLQQWSENTQQSTTYLSLTTPSFTGRLSSRYPSKPRLHSNSPADPWLSRRLR